MRVPLWCWWIPVVWLVSLPWKGYTKEPQWNKVHWIPFTDPADKPRDMIANVALLVPFGYSLAGAARRRDVALALTAGAAALVSVSAEATQLFGTARYPSATDVTTAVAGALAAAAWRRRRPAPEARIS